MENSHWVGHWWKPPVATWLSHIAGSMRCVSVLLYFSTVILILNAVCYIRRIWVWHRVGFPSMSVVVPWLVIITLLSLCQMEITEVLRGQSINDCVKVISDHTKSFCVLNETDPLPCSWPCVLVSLSLCPHMCTQTYWDKVVIHLADEFIQGYLGRLVKFTLIQRDDHDLSEDEMSQEHRGNCVC